MGLAGSWGVGWGMGGWGTGRGQGEGQSTNKRILTFSHPLRLKMFLCVQNVHTDNDNSNTKAQLLHAHQRPERSHSTH